MGINEEKKKLRQEISAIAKGHNLSEISTKANQILIRCYDQSQCKIALYCPFQTEIDLTEFMICHNQNGGTVLLPSIVEVSQPLKFYKWYPKMIFVKGFHNTTEAEERIYDIPDIVIVPLLACDRENFRLGRGGGYYDRTIEFYKENHPAVKFMSIAAPFQMVNHIPRNNHDQKLDNVIII